MAEMQRLANADADRAAVVGRVEPHRGSDFSRIVSVIVRDGSTILILPDRSTLAFAGSASLDQITFLG